MSDFKIKNKTNGTIQGDGAKVPEDKEITLVLPRVLARHIQVGQTDSCWRKSAYNYSEERKIQECDAPKYNQIKEGPGNTQGTTRQTNFKSSLTIISTGKTHKNIKGIQVKRCNKEMIGLKLGNDNIHQIGITINNKHLGPK